MCSCAEKGSRIRFHSAIRSWTGSADTAEVSVCREHGGHATRGQGQISHRAQTGLAPGRRGSTPRLSPACEGRWYPGPVLGPELPPRGPRPLSRTSTSSGPLARKAAPSTSSNQGFKSDFPQSASKPQASHNKYPSCSRVSRRRAGPGLCPASRLTDSSGPAPLNHKSRWRGATWARGHSGERAGGAARRQNGRSRQEMFHPSPREPGGRQEPPKHGTT